jgi:hypothetical protein
VQPLEAARQARVLASLAEYLAEDARGHPDRALAAVASLAEWCDDDPQLLETGARQRARGRRRAPLSAQASSLRKTGMPGVVGARRSSFVITHVTLLPRQGIRLTRAGYGEPDGQGPGAARQPAKRA